MKKAIVIPGAALALGVCAACGLPQQPQVSNPVVKKTAPLVEPTKCVYPSNAPYADLNVVQAGGDNWDVYVNGVNVGTVIAVTQADATSEGFEEEITQCKADTGADVPPVVGYGSAGSTGNTGNSGTTSSNTGSTGNTGNSSTVVAGSTGSGY